MKLFWIPISPYVRKVMIVAAHHGLDARIEYVKTSVSPANPELMQFNPLNKVPTLLLDDETALYDSRVICEYLDSLAPENQRLIPPSGIARWDALRRQALADGLMDLLVAWRGDTTLPPEQQPRERMEKHEYKARETLGALNRERLAPHFDIGAVAVGCAIGYTKIRFPHLLTAEHKTLEYIHSEFIAHAAVMATKKFE